MTLCKPTDTTLSSNHAKTSLVYLTCNRDLLRLIMLILRYLSTTNSIISYQDLAFNKISIHTKLLEKVPANLHLSYDQQHHLSITSVTPPKVRLTETYCWIKAQSTKCDFPNLPTWTFSGKVLMAILTSCLKWKTLLCLMKVTKICNSLTIPPCLNSNKTTNAKTSTCMSLHLRQCNGSPKTTVLKKSARLQSSKMLAKMLVWVQKLIMLRGRKRIWSTKSQSAKTSILARTKRR